MWIESAWLVAPCYLILAGVQSSDGLLFTRGRWGHMHPVLLDHGPIVQCNTDHWECDPLEDVLYVRQIDCCHTL